MYYYRVIYKGVYVIKMREYEEMGSHSLTTRKMKTMYYFQRAMQIAVSLLEERKTAELTIDLELRDLFVGPSSPLLLLLVITAII